MADITKCDGRDCPYKEHCRRYKAVEDLWQPYFVGSPITLDGDCDEYWGDQIEYIKIKQEQNGFT